MINIIFWQNTYNIKNKNWKYKYKTIKLWDICHPSAYVYIYIYNKGIYNILFFGSSLGLSRISNSPYSFHPHFMVIGFYSNLTWNLVKTDFSSQTQVSVKFRDICYPFLRHAFQVHCGPCYLHGTRIAKLHVIVFC